MVYIKMTDRSKELPERLQRIREKLENPEYMDDAIDTLAEKMSRILIMGADNKLLIQPKRQGREERWKNIMRNTTN